MGQRWLAFQKDQEGQAATEYILMLSMAVIMALMVMKKLVAPMLSRLGKAITQGIQDKLFGANLHTFKIGR